MLMREPEVAGRTPVSLPPRRNAAFTPRDESPGLSAAESGKRMGYKKAIVALAHRILVIIYHLLKEQQSYCELGPGHADEQALESSKRWAIRRLEQLSFAVTLTPTDHEEMA